MSGASGELLEADPIGGADSTEMGRILLRLPCAGPPLPPWFCVLITVP